MDGYLVESICVQEMNIRYFLLEEHLEGAVDNYGIRVELEGEQVNVRQITTSRKEIEELLEQLIRGGVTPVAVRDVVEDWLLR